jgi:mono/diheme cytochrome c family protein
VCAVLAPQQSAEGETKTPAAADQQTLESKAMTVLDTYCVSCHGPDKQKGSTRFDALETIDTVDQQRLFIDAQDAVHFDEMPPAKAKQPTAAERAVLLKWFKEQLTGTAADKLEEKLRRPDAGNYVDHDDLFSGEFADLPGYTPDRRWLISEYIFNEKFNRILKHTPRRDIDGKRYNVQGDSKRHRINLTNPFLLPNNAGIRYYANETLNGGHLLTMLTNAKDAADYMLELAERDRNYLPAVDAILAQEVVNRKTLESRQKFLDVHIERVLQDLYQDKHEKLLPRFVRVEVPEPIANDGSVKKAPFHSANPGRDELVTIFRSMRRLKKPGQTDAQLFEACEREWFNFGHDARKIQARITFLNNYLEEFRGEIEKHKYDERNRVIEYKPLAEDEMQVIAEAIQKHRKAGDRYQDIIDKCMADWEAGFERDRIAAGPPSDELLGQLTDELVMLILERKPSREEAKQYTAIAKQYTSDLSRRDLIKKMIQTVILNTDFVYRAEFGTGVADEHGRRMLSPYDASYAIAYALTDASPDAELAKAAAEGRLNTRAEYEREVRRMLAKRDQYYVIDESVDTKDVPNFTNMPIRELRFFRDFFGYDKMLGIFKDNKRFGGNYDNVKTRVVTEADRLVEHILESDQDVFKRLLTTDEFYVYHSGNNEDMRIASDRIKKIYNYFKDKDWRNFTMEDLAKHKDFIAETEMRGIDPKRLGGPDRRYNPMNAFQKQMESFEIRLGKGQTGAAPYPSFPSHGFNNAWNRYRGRLQSPEVARMVNFDLANWSYPTEQPARVPNRKGMLTHPAWLISFAANTETDPIHRGIWIQEKLLAGTIPDVPITVDAVIPEHPEKTLRQRLDDKTNNDYCMRCHVKINPLGIPFEIYDDFGRYRTEERLEYPENLIEKVKDKGEPHEDLRDIYKTLPVEAKGYLEGTGDSSLDGEVDNALDLIDRLAKSDRVRQSIIRHAFRYFMGRNETLNDSKTLIDADRAYLESGGSFDEVIVSLLTSDSFIYRKKPDTTE